MEINNLIKRRKYQEAEALSKVIQSDIKKDRERQTLDTLERDFDTRSWFLGTKQLKNDYKLIPHSIKDAKGGPIPFNKRAE